MAKADDLPASITSIMALPQFPTGPVEETRIQRVADAMLEFGMISPADSGEVTGGRLVASMVSS